MSSFLWSDNQLLGYLDEVLAIAEMAQLEQALRESAELSQRLARLCAQRDAGVHSVGDIWRQHRLSCPTRTQLGSYLLGVLSDGEAEYIEFHLGEVGCRYCDANLADLRAQQNDASQQPSQRRTKFFQTSVGKLRQK